MVEETNLPGRKGQTDIFRRKLRTDFTSTRNCSCREIINIKKGGNYLTFKEFLSLMK